MLIGGLLQRSALSDLDWACQYEFLPSTQGTQMLPQSVAAIPLDIIYPAGLPLPTSLLCLSLGSAGIVFFLSKPMV